MKKLYRSGKDKMIAGICGGLADRIKIDSTMLRLGVVFLGLITAVFPFLITYVIGWIIIPKEDAVK